MAGTLKSECSPLGVRAPARRQTSNQPNSLTRPVARLPHLQGIERENARQGHIPEPTAKIASAILTGRGRTMNTRMNGHELDVVQLRPASAPANDQLDTAGQTILQMIDRAAGVAEEHSRHALEMAQKFSNDLRAAEDRVAELEAELASYRERADRAEQWLHRVYTEVEERFLRQSDARRGVPQNASHRSDLH